MTGPRPWLRTWDVEAEPAPAPAPARPTVSAVKREAKRQRDVARAEGRKRALPVIYDTLAQAAGYSSWAAYRAALVSERTR
ncbi:hypothetical protein [Deinococcus sp. Leaf326]|uniref:hypothetical protein n=1 Tax=Deinococcus sp. Leaf326 TaxID=1736338 RepID=UPI0007127B14|nr:hypothetical protein [Deinococcus sp. Leaf326]KQR02419.1 hypothetical protein ASF71_21480 [Deinococcus sp. Leaf326]